MHIGTHKTGTTALQHFLLSNAPKLAECGVYVPVSGRLADSPEGCGHHCVAWDLLGSKPADPISGTVESLIAELQSQPLSVACISSEEFSHLHVAPNNLQRLHAGLRGIGFRTIIVVYLRPQADYLEALYAEVSRHAPVRDFWACYREILKHGAVNLWPQSRFTTMFDYERLIAPFISIVGEGNVLVRPFRRHRTPNAFIEDFMTAITARRFSIAVSRYAPIVRINERVTFASAMTAIARNRLERPLPLTPAVLAAIEECDGAFDPLRPREMLKIAVRFGLSNCRLFLRYRCWVGCVSAQLFRKAVWSSLKRLDRKHRRRKLLREQFATVAPAADGALLEQNA